MSQHFKVVYAKLSAMIQLIENAIPADSSKAKNLDFRLNFGIFCCKTVIYIFEPNSDRQLEILKY